MNQQPKPITSELISDFRKQFDSSITNKIAQNAVTKNPLSEVVLNRDILTNTPNSFSIHLDGWEVTNQRRSGRCWLFAGLNLFKAGVIKKLNVANFEFSQNYQLFWDKFERSNFFLENIITTADKDVDDRRVAFLLDHPLDDGGQWNMFVNLITKYGVVPKAFMPETESSSNTGEMNALVIAKLREGAKTLRIMQQKGTSGLELQQTKLHLLEIIYRILCIHLGTPPAKFYWQWEDKDREFHRDGEMTPQEFAAKYLEIPYQHYISLVHDPRASNPFSRTYTVEYLGNVIGGEQVKYLNVDIAQIKSITQNILDSGEPVWFGCDVIKMMHRKHGLWDVQLFDYESIYQTKFLLDKESRLLYHDTMMNHAMLFTGVDIVDGKPRRWRVENSWGDEIGEKGFFIMNDNWFDEHIFEIAARKNFLSDEMIEAFKQDPIVLPPWDPMGSLARC